MPSNPGILGSTRLVSSEDAITPTIDFVALYSNWGKAKTQARKRLSALEQYNYVPDLDFLHLLDDLIAFIRNQSYAAGFWSRYHPEAEMRIAGDYVRAAAQRLLIDVTSSASIALLLNKVQAEGLDEESQRYLEFALREARRSGAHLNETDRKRYKAICDELECLKVEFVSIDEEPHLWVDSKQLDNMPEDFRKRYKADPSTGKVRVSLNPSDYITFVEYCQHDETVEKLYELKENMMPENEGLLKAILELRGEQAKLLGYSTYADFAMEVGMTSSPGAVRDFLVETDIRARAKAEDEKRALEPVMKAKNRKLEEWNLPFATRQLLQTRFPEFDPLHARTYFPLSNVVSGAMNIFSMLFSLEFREVQDASTWHHSVRTYDVYNTCPGDICRSRDCHADGSVHPLEHPQLCGRLYLDLLSRNSKAANPCAVELVSSTIWSDISPEICLAAAFGNAQDTCISFTDVSSLMHELGHCVHLLLAQTSAYHRFNGFGNEMDFIEVPSLFLEELLRLPEVVRMMAVDAEGNSLPENYLRALIAERDLNEAMNVRTKTLHSLISLDLHTDLDPTGRYPGETTTLVHSLTSQYGNFPQTQTHMQHSFHHLIDYDCRYYTYVHSLMLVKCVFGRFLTAVRRDGMARAGLNYRRTILEPGARKDARELVEGYLALVDGHWGRPDVRKAFWRWLEEGE